MDLMHKLAKLSEDERRRLVGDFLDTSFGGLEANPEFVGIMRSMTPELPDSPEAEQVEAWVELAELSQDPDFRAGMRRMAGHYAADRAESSTAGLRRDPVTAVRDKVGPALVARIAPASPQADPVVVAVTAQYAHDLGCRDDVDLRRRLLTRLETANDPRRERYLQLLAVINGWPAPECLVPEFDWFIHALRARIPGSVPQH
jgi:hypothetical protein